MLMFIQTAVGLIYRIICPRSGPRYFYTCSPALSLFRPLRLDRLLGRLLAHGLLDVLERIVALLLALGLGLALARELPLPTPASVAQPLLARAEALRLEARGDGQAADAPVVLAVAVVVAQLEQAVRLAGLHARHLEGDARRRELGRGGGLADRVRRHVEAALALGVLRVGEHVVLVEDDANVFAVGVARRVAVVLDVARRRRVDGVVAAHVAVLAGPPVCSSLLVEDVAGDDELV